MALWGPEVIERVKAANDIVDVIGSYLQLKRAGAQFKCLTPFKKERTPSFFVNPARQIWHCFSTDQGGDVIKFLMLYENMDFPSAVRLLAERAGIKLPEGGHQGAGGGEEAGLKEQLIDVMDRVSQWWNQLLLRDPSGEPGRSYLKGRGITSETAREFRLGYAPEAWDATLRWGREHGFAESLLESAGLVVRSEKGGSRPYYDRFRGRVMFPIHSESGRVIAFSGRLLDPNAKEAKYVNSPETMLFTKGKVLYGLHLHKRDLLDARQAVVCEGQVDLITCHQAGIRNMVAPQGTAFTEHQARILKRYVDEVVLCFDSDTAGQAAMARSLPALVEAGLPVRVMRLPDEPGGAKNDPDSFVRRHSGERFRELSEAAVDFWQHYLGYLCEQSDPRTDRGRATIRRELFELLGHLGDATQRGRVLMLAAARLGMSGDLLTAEFDRQAAAARKAWTSREAASEAPPPAPTPVKPHPLLMELLRVALHRPDQIPVMQRDLSPRWLEALDGGALLLRVFEAHNHHAFDDPAAGIAEFPEEERSCLSAILAMGAPDERVGVQVRHCMAQIERLWIEAEWNRRRIALRANPPPDQASALHREILDLRAKLDHLNQLTSTLNPI